jgi:hypothetical protein
MSSTAVAKPNQSPKETLDIFFHLKTLILCKYAPRRVTTRSLHYITMLMALTIAANAQLTHGRSIGGRPRTYDVITTSRVRGQMQYKVLLVGYEENQKAVGKVDVDSKVLVKSGVKLNLNQAMEDLLKKTQEELWKD